MRAGDIVWEEIHAVPIIRKPATFAQTHTTIEAAQEHSRMTCLTPRSSVNYGLGSPLEARQVSSREEPRPLPQYHNHNAARLPSIAQLLNETTPSTAASASKSQIQYGLKDTPPIYGYDTESRCVPRRLPDPAAIEPTLASPPPERRTPDVTRTTFLGRPWQSDYYDPGFTQEQQRNQEQVKGSLTYPRAQDARRQTWAPTQAQASFGLLQASSRPAFAPVVHRSSVPSIEQMDISSTADGYPSAARSYSHSTASYDVVQPELRLRQEHHVAGSYPPAFTGRHHSRSDDYMRYPYQSAYPNPQPYANQSNRSVGYAPLNPAHGRMLSRPLNDVPRKRPKLPPAFKLETRRWIDAHIWHPYPSKEFQQDLAARHGLEQKQVDFHFVNERRRYVVTQLERERAIGNHAPPDLEARNQSSPTVNGSRNPEDRYHPRRYSGRLGRRGSRFSHGSTGSTSTNVSGDSDGPGFSTSA